MTLEQVQRAMAASHPTPAPAPPPVEKAEPAPAPVKPVTIRVTAQPTTVLASTRSHARPVTGTPSTPPPATKAATPEKMPAPGPDVVATDVAAAPALMASVVTTPAPDLFPGPQVAPRKAAGLQLSDDPRIYSKEDADVVPARLLTGQNGAAVTNTVTDINTMELVISKMGRVETAKLSTPPKRMTDMLLLSGAKMWRFTPALKDGQPVRYRTMVSYETIR